MSEADKSRNELVRDAEYALAHREEGLRIGRELRALGLPVAQVVAHDVPLRTIDCPCGFRWLSPPILDVPDNVCPKCGRGPSAAHAGPVVLRTFPIPIRTLAR